MKKRIAAITGGLALGGVLLAGAANAGQLTFSDTFGIRDPGEYATTNWNGSMSLYKFDPSFFGTLESVVLTLTGYIEGDIRLESEDASAAFLVGNLMAQIGLNWAGGDAISQVIPLANRTFNAAEFDGAVDYSGASGISFLGEEASKSAEMTFRPGDDGFASFIGTGTISFDTSAMGMSNGSGAGNLSQKFRTTAGAEVTVVYNYTDTPPSEVPEPTTMLLFGAGLAGLAGVSRRKK